ncbi:lipocalin family protein [Aquimarina aquimarini]|uniref:lipocalin family protein n=1 Tax=Aquimarina aquimarini TaxID=1191734 RepID=UPI001F1C7ED9|nr:lipocalin family protein [Aquimarina aquimarini]
MDIKNKIKILIIIPFAILFSCSNGLEKKITKNWKVYKMEKTINGYNPMNIDINSKMSYNFLPENKVQMITQMGNKMRGTWYIEDSVISIYVKEEKKQFDIIELADDKLTLVSGEFKFFLEK